MTRARAALHRVPALRRDRRRASAPSEILEIWKQLYPRDYRAPNALALSLNRFGQYERAIEEALEAERRNPDHPFPRSNLAYAYRGANRFADARRTAEEAVARKTETLPLRRLLFQLATMDGDRALADATLEWARDRAREFDLIGAQAQAVAFSGQMARARALYEKTPTWPGARACSRWRSATRRRPAWTEALYGNRALGREAGARGARRGPERRAAAARGRGARCSRAPRTRRRPRSRASRRARRTTSSWPGCTCRSRRPRSHLARGEPALALEALQPAQPYELGSIAVLAPVYLRGLALLQHGAAAAAREQFKRGARPSRRRSVLAARSARGAPARPRPREERRRGRQPRRLRRLPRELGGGRRRASRARRRRGAEQAGEALAGAAARRAPAVGRAPRALRSAWSSSAGVAWAVPSLPTTTAGGGVRERRPLRRATPPAASASASVAITVSPAPVTSNTSRAAVGDVARPAAALEQAHARARPRVTSAAAAAERSQDPSRRRRRARAVARRGAARWPARPRAGSASPRVDAAVEARSGAASGRPAPARARGARGRSTRRSSRGGHDALLVVGDDERACTRGSSRAHARRRARASSARGELARVLPVGAHHLLAVRDDAGLERRGAGAGRRSTSRASTPARLRAPRARASPAASRPTTPASAAAPPSERTLRGHVAGAAQVEALRPSPDDRHRGLGRDARDPAPEELVEHHVAEDEHALAAHRGDERLARGERDVRQPAQAAARLAPRWRTARRSAAGRTSAPRSRRDCTRRARPRRPRPSAARAPAAAQRGPRRSAAARGAPRAAPRGRRPPTHHRKNTRPGRPRSAAICSTLSCRCGWRGLGASGQR